MLSMYKDSPSFLIDSTNRLSGTNESFHIKVDLGHDNNYDVCSIIHAGIPLSFYNIDSLNNQVVLSENGGSTIAYIPTGQYDSTTILTALEGALDAASLSLSASFPWTYDVTFDSTSHKLTIVATEHASRTISSGAVTMSNFNPGRILGFSDNSINSMIVDSGTGTVVSSNVCDFARTQYITIKSDIGANHGSVHHDIGVMARIPVNNATFNGMIAYDIQQLFDSTRVMNNNRSNIFSFSLYDDLDRPLNLNGQKWFCTLFCYKHNEVPKMQFDEITYIRKEREKQKKKQEAEKERFLHEQLEIERNDPSANTVIYLPSPVPLEGDSSHSS